MKILITGTTGLAKDLSEVFCNHSVTSVSKASGHNIHQINQWGNGYLDYDCVVNCAYDNIGQQLVLEYFYNNWKNDSNKKIITIGSKIINQPRIESEIDHHYWPYRLHKQALQLTHDVMLATAKCDMKIINPGAFDTAMISHVDTPKISTKVLSEKIFQIMQDPLIKRVDLWL